MLLFSLGAQTTWMMKLLSTISDLKTRCLNILLLIVLLKVLFFSQRNKSLSLITLSFYSFHFCLVIVVCNFFLVHLEIFVIAIKTDHALWVLSTSGNVVVDDVFIVVEVIAMFDVIIVSAFRFTCDNKS